MNRPSRWVLALLFCFLMAMPASQLTGKVALAEPASPSNSPPAQVPGTSLSPGVVDFTNSWGLSPLPPSVVPTGPSEPLRPVHSWTIEVDVPTLIVGDQYSGSYVNQTCSFLDNGTFVLFEGGSTVLGWSGLGGLISGPAVTQLTANSTVAVQRFLLAVGGVTFYDVSVTYSVRYSYGQPSGLKVTIGGHVEWTSGMGNVSLNFLSPALSVQGESAAFGNGSDVTTSFDWSDAAPSYAATVSPDGSSVGWSVGKDFTIDPATITTTTDVTALIGSQKENSRRLIYAQGLYWLFYTKSSYKGFYYTSSPNGTVWATPVAVSSLGGNGDYSFWVNTTRGGGATVYCVTNNNTYPGTAILYYYRCGYMSNDGSINWNSESSKASPSSYNVDTSSISVDKSGLAWVFLETHSGSTYYGRVLNTFGTWNLVYTCSPSGAGIMANLVPIASGMAVVWTWPGANALYVKATANNGATWSATVNVTGYAFNATTFKATSMGDTVYVTASNGSRVYFLSYAYGGASWSPVTDLGAGLESTITSAGQNLVVGYLLNSTTVAFEKSPNNGTTWDSSLTVTAAENASITMSSPPFADAGALGFLAWVSGSSSPYAIRTATFPVVVPNAASSPNAWSRPGLSPYESYFAHLSEYVSPGNGLLGIEQADYFLPGRGINLTFERVFSTPYAFTPSSPYMYENYSAVNMGLGWGLNLPWFGQDYFHFWDGQVYQYNWNGSTFENHVGENFELVNNSGSSYDLYMVSGMDYHFDSSKRLVSVTDPTGNNSITFSYGGNGEISTITDAVGRNVSLVYDGDGRLSTLVTPGGNWTYSYSGGDLASVSDPLGRTTSYQYLTGINSWLLSGIVYPAGGKTTYTYDNASVGTEVLTFMVSLQNINVSSSALSRSTQFNYSVSNGQIMWCNTSISDGTGIVSSVLNNFTQSYSSQAQKDGVGHFVQGSKSYYDSDNRITYSESDDSAGNQLENMSTMFDNWGNLVHVIDPSGHDTWYSYANTNTSNTFPNSTAFSNSFYDNSGVNPNIHDLLVGEAQYQRNDTEGKVLMETYYQYNYGGHLLQQKSLHDGGWVVTSNATFDRYGNQLTSTNALNVTIYYQFSSAYSSAYLTQLSLLVDGVNVSTAYAYNFSTGAKTSETDPNGHTTSYSYDALGRVTLIIYPAVSGISATKRYAFNDTGNYVVVTDEDGNPTRSYFDGLGRLVEVARYSGSSLYSTENYTYNWLDLQSSKTTSAGGTYTYFYDAEGRQTSMVNPDLTYANTTYDDNRDDMTSIVNSTDESGHLTQKCYDLTGSLAWVRQYHSSSSYYQTNYTYDMVGNLLSVTDPNGMVTYYGYDDMNRLNFTSSASLAYVPVQVSFALAGDTVFPVTMDPSSYYAYESPDLGNVRFYNDSGLTTPLVSWLEGYSGNTTAAASTATNATFWVKFHYGVQTQPATIYMAFLNVTSEFDGNYSGEAPQLSPTYAQYDNGRSVFTTFYDNFAGDSLNSTLWADSGGFNYTVSDGFRSNGTATVACRSACNPPNALMTSSNSSLINSHYSVNFYGTVWASDQSAWVEVGGTNATVSDPEGSYIKSGSGGVYGMQVNSTGSGSGSSMGTSMMTGVWTIALSGGTPVSSDYYFNGGDHKSASGAAPTLPMALGLRAPQGYYDSRQNVTQLVTFTLSLSWIRVLPSDLRPTATVGSLALAYWSNQTMKYDGMGNLVNETDAR
ncbi:MAG TPA: hypothetical protein VMS77_07960, partial [Conexivisphaerales archaeon]|nr:hypothetical protein [Conexivisphaerales archaeon]